MLGAVHFEHCSMQVANDAFGVGEFSKFTEIGVTGGIEGGYPCVDRSASKVEHEFVVASKSVKYGEITDRSVARNDDLGIELGESVQCGERSFDGTHDHERCAAVKDEVTREQHTSFRNPDDDVVRCVGGRADVMKFAMNITAMHIDAIVKCHHRWFELNVAPINRFEDPRKMGESGRDDRLSAAAVTDYRGRSRKPISVSVISVVVRVDDGAHGSVGNTLDVFEKESSSALGRTGVDKNSVIGSRKDAAVVDPPGAIGLDVCVDTGINVNELWRFDMSVIVSVVSTHR